MLYLIGLGLGDAKDITLKGLEIVKSVSEVYLENYTSILCCGQEELEKLYERPITLVDREMMEQGCREILDVAQTGGAAVLVVGDPLNATTHTDLLLRAADRKIPYQIIHNASIINAVACCGLQIYNFGETVSIPFWTETWKPDSFYQKICRNKSLGLHTLCLLDIKMKEPNLELLVKGITKMDPPRFMSVKVAAQQLSLSIDMHNQKAHSLEEDEPHDKYPNLSASDIIIGLARVGGQDQKIVKTTIKDALELDLGPPLHSIVVPGNMHPLEEEMINLFSNDCTT